jgi:hypothetical protein
MSESDGAVRDFYGDVLDVLREARIEVLVGGAFAHEHFTGISRDTKDLDLFLRERDLEAALNHLRAAGYQPQIKFSHWLAKVYDADGVKFVDIIFNSGNGLCRVDDCWFERAPSGSVFGRPVKFCPLEETIWQKSFIMERERYDGADIAHLLHVHGENLDWQLLLDRFDGHWRILLNNIILYGYIYPNDRSRIPSWVQQHLLDRAGRETESDAPGPPVCAGTFLSRSQYQVDTERWGYRDARVPDAMTPAEVETWTKAAEEEKKI